MSNIVKGLGWLAVLPGAVLFIFVVMFPIHWAAMLVAGENFAVIERFANAFFTPLCFIFAGAWIAPQFKRQTAFTMAGLAVLLILVLTGYVIATKEILWGNFIITIALQIAGIMCGLKCACIKNSRTHSIQYGGQ